MPSYGDGTFLTHCKSLQNRSLMIETKDAYLVGVLDIPIDDNKWRRHEFTNTLTIPEHD